MPPFLFFLIRHALIGFGLAAAFVAVMLGFDVTGLGTLIANSPSGTFAAAILTFALGLTFAGVQMGIAIMALGDRPPEDARPPADLLEPVPVPVRARPPKEPA